MLLQLDVKNYTIIEEVSVSFSDNLNVITGETGAGKSILMGALSLILGARAGIGTLKDKHEKAIIEGLFLLPEREEVGTFFSENELDYAGETILRREINPSGKSRAFINDTPVNLQQLSAFSGMLVDLHQQFDTLQLGQAHFQLNVLDLLAGQKTLLETYQKQYQLYKESRQVSETLEERARQLSKENDYNRFLFDELEEAGFVDNELEDLHAELQAQTHVEDLKRNLGVAAELLETGDPNVITQLRQVQSQLESLSSYHNALPALLERLSSAQIELQDISDELQQIDETVEYDEERITIIQDRLNTGYKLLKKHQLQTTEELLALRAELKGKLEETGNLDEELKKAQQESERLLKKTKKLAADLTRGRGKQKQPFVSQLQVLLKRVGMPNARMKVVLTKGALTET